RPALALYQVELAVAQGEPCATKVERRWPFDLRQSHDLAVESSRTLQVRDRERDVVQGTDAKGHGGTDDDEGAAGLRRPHPMYHRQRPATFPLWRMSRAIFARLTNS